MAWCETGIIRYATVTPRRCLSYARTPTLFESVGELSTDPPAQGAQLCKNKEIKPGAAPFHKPSRLYPGQIHALNSTCKLWLAARFTQPFTL